MTTATQPFWPTVELVAAVEGADSLGYISGGMTGIAGGNAGAFDGCATGLRGGGFTNIVSPAELDRQRGFDIDGWDGHSPTDMDINVILSQDIEIVARSKFVVALPGWEHSGGATLEIAVAARLGKSIYLWHEDTATLEPLELSSIIAVCHQDGYTGAKMYGRIA